MAQGDREWGLPSVHHMLSLLLLPPQGKDSSWSSPAPLSGPSQQRQFSKNFFNISPSHGLSSLQTAPEWVLSTACSPLGLGCSSNGSPAGSTVLPENLLQCGLFLPRGQKSSQEPAAAQSSHGVTSFFQAFTFSSRGSSMGCRWISATLWISMGFTGTPASSWSGPWAAGESLLQHLEHLLPFLVHSPWCLPSCSSLMFSLLSSLDKIFFLHNNYIFFLKTLSPEALPPLLIGSTLAILELAGIGFTRHRGHFLQLLTRVHFCSPITNKILAWNPNISLQWFVQIHWVFHIFCSWLKKDSLWPWAYTDNSIKHDVVRYFGHHLEINRLPFRQMGGNGCSKDLCVTPSGNMCRCVCTALKTRLINLRLSIQKLPS